MKAQNRSLILFWSNREKKSRAREGGGKAREINKRSSQVVLRKPINEIQVALAKKARGGNHKWLARPYMLISGVKSSQVNTFYKNVK